MIKNKISSILPSFVRIGMLEKQLRVGKRQNKLKYHWYNILALDTISRSLDQKLRNRKLGDHAD